MSDTITLTKEFEVRVYTVTCKADGDEHQFTATIDSDGDILIEVEPCETCRKERE
jgi:hypothetical protein